MTERLTAMRMRRSKRSFKEIAAALGTSEGAVRAQLRDAPFDIRSSSTRDCGPRPTVPHSVEEEWIARMLLEPRDLTAALLGDPLPGYSALDQRNGRVLQRG